MRVIDGLNELLKAGSDATPLLDQFLSGIAAKVPDLAPELDEYLAKLNEAMPPTAEDLIAELKNVLATRKLNPRTHPSDLSG